MADAKRNLINFGGGWTRRSKGDNEYFDGKLDNGKALSNLLVEVLGAAPDKVEEFVKNYRWRFFFQKDKKAEHFPDATVVLYKFEPSKGGAGKAGKARKYE